MRLQKIAIKISSHRSPALLWLLLALAGCAPAYAQSSDAPEPPAAEPVQTIPVQSTQPKTSEQPSESKPQEPTQTRLDDVVVTATKREKSARDIPVTVHAYSGEELMRRGATNLEELVKLQPGTSKNGNRVVMRGIATSSLGTYATSEEVGRFFSDVSLNAPATRGALADLDPFDLQSIEIAKGPQATLFGGTALAGAVRYVPNKPDLSGFSGALRAGFGSVAHSDELQKEGAAMFNAGFADSVGVRVVGSWRTRPGTIDDLRSGAKDIETRKLQQARALASWQPSSALALDASYLRWQEDQTDLGFTDQPDKYQTSIRRIEQPSYMKASVLSLRAEYQWEALSLIGQVSRLHSSWFDIVDLSGPLGVEQAPASLPLPVAVQSTVPAYELRLVSSAPSQSDWWMLRDWDYLVGVFLMQAEQSGDSHIIASEPLPTGELVLADVATKAFGTTEERAVFFDVTRALLDRRLELNLGGRLARSKGHGYGYYNQAGMQQLPQTRDNRDSRFNPKLALTWHFSKNYSIYASAAQGFRYGGANGNPTAGVDIPRTFTSDSLWNYEIGLRTEWLDHALRFDVTAFRIDWKDLQIQQISTTEQNFVSNVGGARVRGAETALRWALPDDVPILPGGLSVTLGGSYIDDRITTHFESSDGPVEAGTRLPLTPYLLASGSLNWNGGIGSWLLAASVSDAYAGERKNQLVNTITLPGYQSVGATFRVSNPSLRFAPEISLSGTNILDEPAINFGFKAKTGPNKVYVLNRPRTLLLSAQVNF